MTSPVNTPTISVIIPIYCHTSDHEMFLSETLRSVAVQTYRDFELILVDDCSPLDITSRVESISGIPCTRVIRNQANLGHAESRNAAIRIANGDYIAFLDHDDIWLPEKLQRQMEVLKSNPEAAMVFCKMEMFGPKAGRLAIDQNIIPERPDFYWFMRHGNYTISASSVLIKKKYLIDIGLFDNRYTTSDDFDAWLKVLMRAPIIFLPEALARYRLHDSNVNYSVDRYNDTKLLWNIWMQYWQKAPVLEKLKISPRMARKLLSRVYFAVRRHRSFKDSQ